jgi:RNA polymerase sigma factor (sigma-70 family)
MTLFQENRTLLDAFRRGEESALRAIYDYYINKVELLVANGWYDAQNKSRSIGIVDFEVQAELIQEIFLKAFSDKARLSYDGIRPYKNFLISIARNVIIDHLRKTPRDVLSLVDAEFDINSGVIDSTSLADSEPHAETDLDWQRCLAATAEYVKGLDEMNRKFVVLRFQQELPILEVSRQMGITRGKARFLEKNLARNLKKRLQTMNLSLNWRE